MAISATTSASSETANALNSQNTSSSTSSQISNPASSHNPSSDALDDNDIEDYHSSSDDDDNDNEEDLTLTSALLKLYLHSPAVRLEEKILLQDPTRHAPIKLDYRIINEHTDKVFRYASVEFFRCERDSFGNDRTIEDKGSTIEKGSGIRKVTFNFDYTSALVAGVDNVLEEWPQEAKTALAELSKYRQDGNASFEVSCRRPTENFRNAEAVLDFIQSSSPTQMLHSFRQCSDLSSNPSSWRTLEHRYRDHEFRSSRKMLPATHTYSSPEVACLKMTHARYLDDASEMRTTLPEGELEVGLMRSRNEKYMMAFVRKVEEPWKTRHQLGESTAIEIDYNDPDIETRRNPKLVGRGTLMLENPRPNIKCAFVLLLSPTKTPEVSSADWDEEPDWGRPRIYMKGSEHANLQVNAINTFFGQHGLYSSWWASFLGEANNIQTRNFLVDKLGVSSRQIRKTVRRIINKIAKKGLHLNPEQENILRDIGNANGGFSLIRGPPGTGKSTTISLLINAYLQFPGVAVYGCAQSNGAVNRLAACTTAAMTLLDDTDPRKKPLRAGRKYHERQHIENLIGQEIARSINLQSQSNVQEPSQQVEDSSIEVSKAEDRDVDSPDGDIDIFSRVLEAEDKRLWANPDDGLMGSVHQAIVTGQLHQDDDVVWKETKWADSKRELQRQTFLEAKVALERVRLQVASQKGVPFGDLIESDIGKIRKQILGAQRLILSTTANATNLLLRDAIFRDSKFVVVIIDEQSLETDASTAALIAGLIDRTRIEREFEGEPPVIHVVLVGDEKQGSPLIKSEQSGVNFFGPQAALSTFRRLVESGFPVQTLLEQHRMAPILRELPSRRGYDDLLRDSAAVKARRLDPAAKRCLQQYFHVDFKGMFQDQTAELQAYSEDQYVRHLMLNVENGVMDREERGKSRFNVRNLEATRDLLEYLIANDIVTTDEVVILVPYKAQRNRYERDYLQRLERKLRLKSGSLFGCVETSDSYQGRECDCVILDLVWTDYFGYGKLGK